MIFRNIHRIGCLDSVLNLKCRGNFPRVLRSQWVRGSRGPEGPGGPWDPEVLEALGVQGVLGSQDWVPLFYHAEDSFCIFFILFKQCSTKHSLAPLESRQVAKIKQCYKFRQ